MSLSRPTNPALFGLAAALVLCAHTTALAGARRFTFSYEASTQPKGAFEYEQWVTWKAHKEADPDFDRLDFRHEIEYGLTDRLQLALYLSDWRYEDGDSVDDGADWRNVAFEVIYNLTNPVADPIGSAVYGEVKVGDELLALESKLILQKDIGPWSFVWNGTFEAEWEGSHYQEDKGELAQTLGVSYELLPQIIVGGELLHEVEIEDWEEFGDHALYIGPNVGYRADRWWVTITPLFQVTDLHGEADFETRLIFGIDF